MSLARRPHHLLPPHMLCVAFLASLFWGSVSQLDPLGLKTAVDLQSEAMFMRLIGGPWYRSGAQDAVSVVLIDDLYVQETGEHWPLSYLQQDLLLNDILDLQPRAVFLDLLYRHNHDGSDGGELGQYIETINQATHGNESSIPIYIPYLVKDVKGVASCNSHNGKWNAADLVLRESVISDFQKSGATPTYIGWTGCGNRYPSTILGDEQYRTPAYALFKEVCTRPHTDLPGCPDTLSAKRTESENKWDGADFQEAMAIRWGTGVSFEQQSALQKGGIDCLRFDENHSPMKFFFRQLAQIMLFDALFEETTEHGIAERCTYTDTVHATWFLGASPELRQYLKGMIKDRVVLVGTRIEGVHDMTYSPVNGQLPGIYLIAMALDNYLKYGLNYYRDMPAIAAWILEVITIFLVVVLSVLGWNWTTRNWVTSSTGEGERPFISFRMESIALFLVFRVLFPVLVAFVLTLILWDMMHYAPMDWIGISVLAFMAMPISTNDCIEADPIESIDSSLAYRFCSCRGVSEYFEIFKRKK